MFRIEILMKYWRQVDEYLLLKKYAKGELPIIWEIKKSCKIYYYENLCELFRNIDQVDCKITKLKSRKKRVDFGIFQQGQQTLNSL